MLAYHCPPTMSRPRRESRVKREVVVKEEVQEVSDDDGGEGEEAAVEGDDPVGVYETEEHVPPSRCPVSGRWCA
jgi:hypothetical protein